MQPRADRPLAAVDRVLQTLPTDGGCKRLVRIMGETGLEKNYVRRKLKALVEMGLVGNKMRGCYWLTDAGIGRRNAGQLIGPTRSRKRGDDLMLDRLWAAMRAERNFGVSTLLRLAGRDTDPNPLQYTRRYINYLVGGGVLLPLNRLRNGEQRWRLIHDLGPDAPTWSHSHKTLWDWNAKQAAEASIRARESQAVAS